MNLGVHCSIAGGYETAFLEAQRLGIDCFQIFTKNQRQWKEKIVTAEESKNFRAWRKKYKLKFCFSHCTYLINIGSADETIYTQSVSSLIAEVLRCDALGMDFCVLHPGSFKNTTKEDSVRKIIAALTLTLEQSPKSKVKVLLENTAGQGSSIGGDFETIGGILKEFPVERVGTCFDTCHAFVSGYDIRTAEGCESVFDEIDRYIGIDRLNAFHLNDSKGALGSHLDRHHHIGHGLLGLSPFDYIMNRFPHVPKVLETSNENEMDMKNLETLRSLIK